MFTGLGLLAIAILILAVGTRWLNPGAFGLHQLARQLFAAGLIDAEQGPAVAARTERMTRWRARGAIAGAVLCALVSLLPPAGISVSFLAVLAGALGGMAAAEWWSAGRDRDPIRSASLVHRSLSGVVGRTPIALLIGTLTVALVSGLTWLVTRPDASGTIHQTALREGRVWSCTRHVPTAVSVASSLLLPLVTVAGAVVVAVTITRRRADQTLPAVADEALRAAGVRGALGGAISIAAGAAASLVYRLVMDGFTSCGPQHGFNAIGGLLGAIGCFLLVILAIASVFRYILRPAQLPTMSLRQPVS